MVTESEAKTFQTGVYNKALFTEATGGTVTTSGDFKIHSFTGDGTFVVSTVESGDAGGGDKVDYVVVAGGGSGGDNLTDHQEVVVLVV